MSFPKFWSSDFAANFCGPFCPSTFFRGHSVWLWLKTLQVSCIEFLSTRSWPRAYDDVHQCIWFISASLTSPLIRPNYPWFNEITAMSYSITRNKKGFNNLSQDWTQFFRCCKIMIPSVWRQICTKTRENPGFLRKPRFSLRENPGFLRKPRFSLRENSGFLRKPRFSLQNPGFLKIFRIHEKTQVFSENLGFLKETWVF